VLIWGNLTPRSKEPAISCGKTKGRNWPELSWISFPGPEQLQLPDANHFFMEDDPEIVIEEMRSFLATGTS
jgi:pimeloyl-ACP methyl ester carboxylesterase